MTLTRRQFLRSATGAAAVPFVIASSASARRRELLPFTYLAWQGIPRGPQRPLGASGYGSGMMVGMGEGGNSLSVARGREMLLIDCKNAPFGALLKREASITPFGSGKAGLSLVINTHHHADHTGGNWAFTGEHAVLAHAKAPARIAAQFEGYIKGAANAADRARGDDAKSKVARRYLEEFAERAPDLKAEDFKPTETLKSDHEKREVGGMTIELRHFGPGHTDTDVVVFFPEENVVHAGDLVFNGVHPYCDATSGCSTTGWQESLSKLIDMCDDGTVVVPGHGAVGDIKALRAQRLYFDRVRELVKDAKGKGMSRDAVTALPVPDAYAGYGNKQFWGIVLGFVYDELS